MLTWKVKNFDTGSQTIKDYDVLKYREDFIKKLKKQCANRAEFSEALKREFHWQYWSRSEYELLIYTVSGRVVLIPWAGCRNPEKALFDVTDEHEFNWLGFLFRMQDKKHSKEGKIKIDVWDQLEWQWDKLVDYCWYTRLPYERKHPKFERS